MAEIIHRPSTHNCRGEIGQTISVLDHPVGTIVKCSCGNQFKLEADMRERFWAEHQPVNIERVHG